jgi:hypothetical protein
MFLPFGLMNAPTTFQAIMEKVLEPFLWKNCVLYIDGLAIFSQTKEEHLEHLAEVLRMLDETGLHMKVETSPFGVRQMQLLGFDFREDGMQPQEERALKIQQVQVDHSRTGILSFLGIVRYYQCFVPHLADLSQPLTSLLRKERCSAEWGPAQDQAVWAIKDIFKSPDVRQQIVSALIIIKMAQKACGQLSDITHINYVVC